MIVLDTNVISEAIREHPAASVAHWLDLLSSDSLYTTAQCEAEILYGLAILPAGRKRSALEQRVELIFEQLFPERVLPLDRAAARRFAEIVARRRGLGRPIDIVDAQIAAIVSSNGATLATRDVNDFADCGLDLINPWEA